MPQFGDWQDLSFDYVEIKKPYRDTTTGEVLTAVYALRDDVPTSVMVRVYGILDLEEDYRALQRGATEGQRPDYEALAAVEEQREAMTLRTLAAIVHHSYPERAILDLEPALRTQFTDKERQDLVALFFTRSLVSRQPPSGSTPTPTPAQPATVTISATGQGATRGKSGSAKSASGGKAKAATAKGSASRSTR